MSEDPEIMSDLCISNLGFPSALYACKLAASWSSSAESQMAKWLKQKNSHPVNDRAIRSSSGRSLSGLKCGTCWCQQWGAWSGAWFPSWARLLLVCWGNLQSIDCSVAVTMIQNSCGDRVQGPTMRQTNNDTSSWLQSLPYSEACCNLQQLRRYQNHFRDSKKYSKKHQPNCEDNQISECKQRLEAWHAPHPDLHRGHGFLFAQGLYLSRQEWCILFPNALRGLFGCRSSLNHEDVTW